MKRRNLRKLYILLLAIFLLTNLAVFMPVVEAAQSVTVIGDYVNIRSGPGTGYGVITTVNAEQNLSVLGQDGDWYKVKLSDGTTGYIASWLTKAISGTPATQVATVTGSYVNIRSGPGTSYDILTTVNNGDKLSILDQQGDWYKVRLADGTVGYIAGWLVQVNTTPAPSPAPTPSPAPAPNPGTGQSVTVTGDYVNIRSGPGTSYGVITTVSSGQSLLLLGQEGDWYKVQLSDGTVGYMANWLGKVNNASPPNRGGTRQTATVTADYVNIRSGPGTNYGVLTTVNNGDKLGVLDKQGDWYKIQLNDGTIGYVAGWLVQVDNAPVPVPSSAPTPSPTPAPSPAPSPTPQPVKGELKGVSFASKADRTVITFNLSGNVAVTASEGNTTTLKVVMDKTRLTWNPPRLAINDKLVKTVTAESSNDQVVVNIELAYNMNYKLYQDDKTLTVELITFGLAGKTIVIDPGHGGSDPGAIGPTGTKEKDNTLAIAQKLAVLLRQAGANVILTRDTDKDVAGPYVPAGNELQARVDVATNNHADLFVSIHNDAYSTADMGGTTTYYNTSFNLNDEESARLANLVQKNLARNLQTRDHGTLQANFYVIKYADMPAVLAEVAYISNPAEEKKLSTDSFRAQAAQALFNAISTYFNE